MALKMEYGYTVTFVDDRGETHWVAFRVKTDALRFAKTIARLGVFAVQAMRVDLNSEAVIFERGNVERIPA